MRNQLHLLKKTLALHWGYSSLSTIDKAQAYTQILANLGKSRIRYAASTHDVRNLGLKQVFFKPRLTPLASTDKKTFSGFDLRLAQLKSPKVLKRTRRAPALSYSHMAKVGYTLCQTLPTLYTGVGLGWARKSSRALNFLTSRPLKVFHKSLRQGYLGQTHCFPGPLLTQLAVITTAEPAALATLGREGNYLVSSELHCPSPLAIQADIFTLQGESPNLAGADRAAEQLVSTAFNEAVASHVTWVTGSDVSSFKYLDTWTLIRRRNSLMRQTVMSF